MADLGQKWWFSARFAGRALSSGPSRFESEITTNRHFLTIFFRTCCNFGKSRMLSESQMQRSSQLTSAETNATSKRSRKVGELR
jgi:hypothetical protein